MFCVQGIFIERFILSGSNKKFQTMKKVFIATILVSVLVVVGIATALVVKFAVFGKVEPLPPTSPDTPTASEINFVVVTSDSPSTELTAIVNNALSLQQPKWTTNQNVAGQFESSITAIISNSAGFNDLVEQNKNKFSQLGVGLIV